MSTDSTATETLTVGDNTNLISVNMVNVTKLSSINYITWSVQVRSLLRGYDLLSYIDAATSIPAKTVASATGENIANPTYLHWIRQDSLIFSSLMGSIETAHQSLIAAATSSSDAWSTLESTYAKPSRGHIKQLKSHLRECVKGSKGINEYIQLIKSKSDALSLLGHPVDPEDLTDIVLDGLGENYKSLAESIHGRDTPIKLSELHEKLINRELALAALELSASSLPIR